MNLKLLLSLFRGGNVWETVGRILDIAAGFVAGLDSDNRGNDDAIADIMFSASSGLVAFGDHNYNKAGEIIDSLIIALQKLKSRWLASGLIVVANDVTAMEST